MHIPKVRLQNSGARIQIAEFRVESKISDSAISDYRLQVLEFIIANSDFIFKAEIADLRIVFADLDVQNSCFRTQISASIYPTSDPKMYNSDCIASLIIRTHY